MKPVMTLVLRLSDIAQRKPTQVRIVPDEGQLEALIDRFEVDALRKVKLEGTLAPSGGRGWTFQGRFGATVVQPCRVTTDPVTTRIEEEVLRRYVPDFTEPQGDEVEMSDDDTVEPLPEAIDMGDLLEEMLALTIPSFPRAEGADDIDLTATPPGAEPITDETIKPFAGLAALRDSMKKDD